MLKKIPKITLINLILLIFQTPLFILLYFLDSSAVFAAVFFFIPFALVIFSFLFLSGLRLVKGRWINNYKNAFLDHIILLIGFVFPFILGILSRLCFMHTNPDILDSFCPLLGDFNPFLLYLGVLIFILVKYIVIHKKTKKQKK